MPARRVRIKGTRGRWLARVAGRDLPVLHQSWRNGLNDYLDPMEGVDHGGAKYRELVSALSTNDLCVIQKDRQEGATLARAGYVGVFRYTDFHQHPDGSLTLRLTEKVGEPER